MNRFQNEIYESMLYLRKYLEEERLPNPQLRGICAIVYRDLSILTVSDVEKFMYLDAISEFKFYLAHWPEGTKSPIYPVPSGSNSTDAMNAFNKSDDRTFWLVGPYASMRYKLLCHLIQCYQRLP